MENSQSDQDHTQANHCLAPSIIVAWFFIFLAGIALINIIASGMSAILNRADSMGSSS